MGITFNPEQQAAINAYRKKHKIAPIITDDAVITMIKSSGGSAASIFNDNNRTTKQYNLASNRSTTQATQKTNNQAKSTPQHNKSVEDKELKELELINTNGAGSKIKSKRGKEYTVVGNASNGRKIVKDAKGQYQILAHDGTFLNKEVIKKNNKVNAIKTNSQMAHSAAINTMRKQLASAQKSFNKQLSQDGWAGDIADGISVLWGSDNRASKVRIDLNEYGKNIQDLQKAAKKGGAQFNAKFKQIYGKDFNQQAMAEYAKNPTQKNYEKVFGTKNNIDARVKNYNKSQQTGAEVVKTTAKVGAGVAIGVATVTTGGAAGLAITAAGTALSSAMIDETDRLNVTDAVTKGKVNFRKGTDHKKIMTNAAFDGISTLAGGVVGKVALTTVKGTSTGAKVARATINTVGDVGVGAAQEYVETGHVTTGGIVSNSLMSGVGGAVVSGSLKGVGKSVKFVKSKVKSFKARIETQSQKLNKANNVSQATKQVESHTVYDKDGNVLAGGIFNFKSSGSSFVSSLFGSSRIKQLQKQAKENLKIQSGLRDPGTVHISQKLQEELNNPTIAKELPADFNINEISSQIKSGEVCTVGTGKNQKLYINKNGTAQEILLSREKFDELFPQGGFAMTSQNGQNYCWLLARINAMTGSDVGKAELYSMFKELPNGDVQITLKNTSRPIVFPQGKPVGTESSVQLKKGAAPGVEMLMQAVQANRLKAADRPSGNDITKFSLTELDNIANKMGTDLDSTASLLTKGNYSTTRIQSNDYSGLEETLSSFNSKTDMGTVTFEAHARTIVDYNPHTQTVTYHNPYNGGVDNTCSLAELKQKFASFAVTKPKKEQIDITDSKKINSTTSRASSNDTGIKTSQATVAPTKSPVELTYDQTQIRNKNSSMTKTVDKSAPVAPRIKGNTTPLVRNNYREIARTADGQPIYAMVSQDSVVINKNGKISKLPISEIKENSFFKNSEVSLYSVEETSTKSYIVIECDKYGTLRTRQVNDDEGMYKLMDEFDQKTKNKMDSTTSHVSSNDTGIKTSQATVAPTKSPVELTYDQTQIRNKNSSRLAVPNGFKVNQEVNGKRILISTDGKARVLMERNNRWMEMDNNGRFREYTGN